MAQWYEIDAVERMQNYIKAHVNECIEIDHIAAASGYSRRHAIRLFKDLLGKTPMQYVRAIRLTASAKALINEQKNVLEVALDSGYSSHEGFTRAFTHEFGIAPKRYQQERPPIKYFMQYPIRHCYSHFKNMEGKMIKQENPLRTCTVTIIKRPKRKLMIMRAKQAHDYWSFCEEKGCDWTGLFNSIDCKIESAAIVRLPENMVVDGTTDCAAGIEIPYDYNGKVIDGCELIELDECDMMIFQGQPYEDDNDYGVAIDEVSDVIKAYDPKQYGYEFALDSAPRYGYGASKETGAKEAIPIKKIAQHELLRFRD